MKLRLFLFLFVACSVLVGNAMAQGCTVTALAFPVSGGSDRQVTGGTCIANADSDSPNGQGGRLRWEGNDNTPGRLQLFDADDGGQSLWCALDSVTGACALAELFCLQQDGNAVLYQGDHTQGTPHCGQVGSNPTLGRALWSSNTDGDNDNFEKLDVEEQPGGILWNGALRTGDHAVVRNSSKVLWVNTGQNSGD